MSYFLGIDPGLSGALAWYDPMIGDLIIKDMPVFEITTNRKTKRQIDLNGLAGMISGEASGTRCAIVEQVNALPKQGVTSSFNFGFSAGATQMAVAAAGIPIHTVVPAKWKRIMGLTADKDASRRMASRLFPKYTHLWPLKKHDGRAEAALLAKYAVEHMRLWPQCYEETDIFS